MAPALAAAFQRMQSTGSTASPNEIGPDVIQVVHQTHVAQRPPKRGVHAIAGIGQDAMVRRALGKQGHHEVAQRDMGLQARHWQRVVEDLRDGWHLHQELPARG